MDKADRKRSETRYTWYRQLVFDPENWFPDEDGYKDTWRGNEPKTSTCLEAMQKFNHYRFCLISRGYFRIVPPQIEVNDSIFSVEGDIATSRHGVVQQIQDATQSTDRSTYTIS